MNKITATIIAVMILGAAMPGFADWEIGFGKDKGQVSLRAPINDEDVPVGPSSYRLINNDLWVLDSAGGAIRCYGADNKIKSEMVIAQDNAKQGFAKDALLDDFAVQIVNGEVTALIAVDSMHRQIIKFDKQGKELLQLKISPEQLIQMDAVEIDSKGQFYVGDFAKSYIAVFSADGKLLRTIPWQCSGFAVDGEDNLHLVDFVETKGHSLLKLAADGKELARLEIGMTDAQNPMIWGVNAKGETFVAVVPPEGEPTNYNLLTISAAGEVLNKVSFQNPYYINRYLLAGNDSVWLVNADYTDASSKIKIAPIK